MSLERKSNSWYVNVSESFHPRRDASLELEPCQRMGLHVHVLLRAHPMLEPARRAGASVWVDADRSGISAFLVRGAEVVEARLSAGAWWEPNVPARGDELAGRLAALLSQGAG